MAVFAAALLSYRALLRLDHAVDHALYHKLGPAGVNVCFVTLQLGSAEVLALLGAGVGLVLLFKRRWTDLAGWASALVGCAALDYLLKHAFRRPRPPTLDWLKGYTFPSGHTMGAAVAYGMLAYFVCRREPRPARRRWIVAAAAGLVLLTAGALVFPGFHYASDVFAGYAVGISWLAGCVVAMEAVRRRRDRPNAGPTVGPDAPLPAYPLDPPPTHAQRN